jgi:hypothetical protein
MPTLTRGAHAEKLGTAFYPAKTDVSGNIEVGSFQRRGPSQFEGPLAVSLYETAKKTGPTCTCRLTQRGGSMLGHHLSAVSRMLGG